MGQWNKTEQHVKRDNETELARCVCVCVCLVYWRKDHMKKLESSNEPPCLKQQKQTEQWTKNSLNFF